jgi:HSP90 family molecular chaperone
MPDNRVGLEPAPDDDKLVEWLREKIDKAEKDFNKLVSDFHEVVDYGIEEGEPFEFAYARLLNFCASLSQKELIELLSGATWYVRHLDT